MVIRELRLNTLIIRALPPSQKKSWYWRSDRATGAILTAELGGRVQGRIPTKDGSLKAYPANAKLIEEINHLLWTVYLSGVNPVRYHSNRDMPQIINANAKGSPVSWDGKPHIGSSPVHHQSSVGLMGLPGQRIRVASAWYRFRICPSTLTCWKISSRTEAFRTS